MKRYKSNGPAELLWALALLCAAGVSGPGAARAATNAPPALTLVQWNVENLFDAEDDPTNPGDDEYTPGGEQRWTDALYRRKLEHLASILWSLHADLIGLEEVENRRVLEDLSGVLRKRYGQAFPYIVHREGPDHRGIDVALLSRLAPQTNTWLSSVPSQRDMLVARFSVADRPLVVMVNHWKSRRGSSEEGDEMRMQEAKSLHTAVAAMLKREPNLAIVAMGDFNDSCDGPALRGGAKCTLNVTQVLQDPAGAWLYNLHGLLPQKERGTIYYAPGKTWNSFDSMSVSRSLVNSRGTLPAWRVDLKSYAIVRDPRMMDENRRPAPFRLTGSGSQQQRMEGYSDHFPVRVRLVLKRAAK